MVKITTQPPKASTSNSIPLRSGFFSIKFKSISPNSSTSTNSKSGELYINARIHTSVNNLNGVEEVELGEGVDEQDEEDEGKKLFITSLPLNTTEEVIKKAFTKLYPSNKVINIQLILPTNNSINSIQSQSFESDSTIQPLFISTFPIHPSPVSAIIQFKNPPSLTAPFPLISWPFSATTSPSFINLSNSIHQFARPNLSTIIAHSDSWMSSLDRKKIQAAKELAILSASFSTKSIANSKPNKKSNNKNNNSKSSTPLPGSAAFALSAHLASVARGKDRTINPDAIVEEDWTLVSRGGKHGKSLLPIGAKAGISGYGGVNVKVARRVKLGEEKVIGEEGVEEEEEKVKGIVGPGFYSFSKADTRRAGKFLFSF